MKKAVFFDRDATLIVDKHYMHKIEDIEYYEDSFSALKTLKDNGYIFFIVTNQSGIGRGLFSEEAMHKVHEQIVCDYKENELEIVDIEFCPHTPQDLCDCRKPSPSMILKLASKHNIDLSKSYMVGDKQSDVDAGNNAGCMGLLIGASEHKSLSDIANYIISRDQDLN